MPASRRDPSLLFLCHRIPFPPNKGDKIRAFQMLKHLAAHYRLYLGCFIDDPDDWAHRPALEELCAEVACFPLPSWQAPFRAAGGLISGRPLSIAMMSHRGMRRWVHEALTRVRPEAVLGFSSAVGQYLLNANLGGARFVMDFVDVDSDKWRQYAADARPPTKWIYGREARGLLAFDRALAAQAHAGVYVSEAEAALFRSLAPEVAEKTYAVENGIDCVYFSPDHVFASPFTGAGPHLVFTGTMDYRPNVDAVVWFATEILPLIRQRAPGATFTVVGAKPSRDVQALAALPAVTVTGRVDDVRPYLRHADAVVAPLRLARGVQNKVLEGMAMGRPVVTTPQGLEGIAAQPGRELIVASTAAEFAEAVHAAVLPESAAIGAAARALMLDRYAWDSRLAVLGRLLAG